MNFSCSIVVKNKLDVPHGGKTSVGLKKELSSVRPRELKAHTSIPHSNIASNVNQYVRAV